MHKGRMNTIQSKLDQCESGSQDAVTTRKELDLCHHRLSDEQKSTKDLKRNIKTLQNNNDKLQNQLTSKNNEIENLRNRIRGLEREETRIQSDSTTIGTTIVPQLYNRYHNRYHSSDENEICRSATGKYHGVQNWSAENLPCVNWDDPGIGHVYYGKHRW